MFVKTSVRYDEIRNHNSVKLRVLRGGILGTETVEWYGET
jgi:hypothetical protein